MLIDLYGFLATNFFLNYLAFKSDDDDDVESTFGSPQKIAVMIS
jgi:hypothetical protein